MELPRNMKPRVVRTAASNIDLVEVKMNFSTIVSKNLIEICEKKKKKNKMNKILFFHFQYSGTGHGKGSKTMENDIPEGFSIYKTISKINTDEYDDYGEHTYITFTSSMQENNEYLKEYFYNCT